MTSPRPIGLQIASVNEPPGGPEFADVPEPPETDLARLKSRMAAARKRVQATTYRIPVPGMTDVFVVEYEAIDSKVTNALAKQVADVKGTQADLEVRTLAAHCRGVYLVTEDGKQVSAAVQDPDGPAPRFDARLAEAFEEPFTTTDLLLRGFYGTDGAIHSVWEALWDLSGYGHGLELAEATRGN